MVKRFLIIVEGEADKKFFKDYFHHLFNEKSPEGCIIHPGKDGDTGGYQKLRSEDAIGIMRQNTDLGSINLVIFDADDNIVQRRTDILSWKARHNVEFELFLIPDDSAQGALEELLERIINEENKPVMDCWFDYERSLMEVKLPWKNGESLTIPAKKTKIYAYLEVLLGKERSQKNLIKEKHRIYHNENHWNLNADALRPLSNFLKNNL